MPPPPAAAGGEASPRREARPRTPRPDKGSAKSGQSDDPDDGASTARRRKPVDLPNPLLTATSWGYQLQRLDLRRAAASPFDILVVDYSYDGTDAKALQSAEIERLKQKPDGGRRTVLAYLSIGEAEGYRYYWNPAWTTEKPSWLLSENPDWEENFAVCFWDPDWQKLICGSPESYLDKLIAAGFDGVYLDKCDVFEDLERRERKAARGRTDLEGDMVRFVVRLSQYAKSRAPAFLVVMQNAETLLAHEALRAAIDGVAKEELLFGLSGPQRKNARAEIEEARRAIDLAKQAGKAVLMVEYLDDPAKAAEAARYAAEAGYALYVAPKDRELDRLNYDAL